MNRKSTNLTPEEQEELKKTDEFWERCLELMRSKGLTQQSLSEKLWNNKRRIETLIFGHRLPLIFEVADLAKELNVPIDYLITGTSSDPYKKKYDDLVTAIKELPIS